MLECLCIFWPMCVCSRCVFQQLLYMRVVLLHRALPSLQQLLELVPYWLSCCMLKLTLL
ncbi:hypothetical protein EJ02DRAFT_143270 [Clathrospora elynae]|uniref:Uncharacterized protein n=1 Tax=Clathrospora elynae TaxID=706981 RepID=A0A6A5S9Z9_9PLEO|nr:hypothetical protein EJ02DRAFT_143270 [Clathrospora elynae]